MGLCTVLVGPAGSCLRIVGSVVGSHRRAAEQGLRKPWGWASFVGAHFH